ncbi:MAG TPA: metallophosphoesterase [Chitinophagaceae bacterium]|nr:metallophosphoesterase [Chitinophagaceae bacterium]
MISRITIPFFSLAFIGIFLFENNKQPDPVTPEQIAALQLDGPFVLYKKNKAYIKYILDSNNVIWVQTDTATLDNKKNIALHVSTEFPGHTFPVSLKDQFQNEKSEFDPADKIFALSDIEGDFSSFRRLLQAGGVIDSNFNWTFGNGHLLLVGDFVDRGSQVTEVLWLIYSLEEKAKAAGGYVHYILGNHEILNLSNDLRYVNPKYFHDAKLMHINYEKLFDKNSEIGRWLRTKNVMEKIGNLVFVHGGISAELQNLGLSISRINQLARTYYEMGNELSMDETVNTIMSSKVGPFWYRGYYKNNYSVTPEQLDNIISKFSVSHIITGHTIAADTISAWYGGKVIDLDVHDNRAIPEALLIEGNKFYRVGPSGQKKIMEIQ